MAEDRSIVRLRQAVLAADELEPVVATLTAALGLGEPFRDPAVAAFGLTNAVFAVGDCFLEVVSPAQPDTAAGRYLVRHGSPCGYMTIFDLEDLDGARMRAEQLGIRAAWEIDLPDISTTHLHPADLPGAIVSLDQSRPFGTWRWGGPEWTGRTGTGAPGRLAGITIAAADPPALAARWGQVLGAPVSDDGQPTVHTDGARVRFVPAADEREAGLREIAVEQASAAPLAGDTIELGEVRVRLLEAKEPQPSS